MSFPIQCELCRSSTDTKELLLFRVKNNELIYVADRGWEAKAGIRHICKNCVKTISQEQS